MQEKSGLEILEEIVRRLDSIERKLDVQDRNIKRIANTTQMADIINKATGTPLDDWARANKSATKQLPGIADAKKQIEDLQSEIESTIHNKKMRFKFESMDASKLNAPSAISHKKATVPASTIMCKGKMLIESKGQQVPLSGVSVKIYDEKDKLIKSTKTNRAGHWMSQLAPGNYVALYEGEFEGQKLVPINKTFNVPDKLEGDKKFIEVV